MSRIYHLLDEGEVFSEFSGGAISRWAANVLRDGNETIICPSFDASWGFPADRLFRPAQLGSLPSSSSPACTGLPGQYKRKSIFAFFRPLLEKLNRGDILYIHNRPETAPTYWQGLLSNADSIWCCICTIRSCILAARKHFPALKDVPDCLLQRVPQERSDFSVSRPLSTDARCL